MKNQISLTALKSLINEQLEIEKKTMITVDAIKLNNTSTSVLEEVT